MRTSETTPDQPGTARALPSSLLAALQSPVLERRDWQAALAPHYIGLFLWIAFFDQLPRETFVGVGLIWPVMGAGLAGVFCYVLLYYAPAMWGMTTGRPLGVLATSTFGIRGATWVPGQLLNAVQVVWLAVATFYGTDLTLRGLQLFQLLDPKYLQPWIISRTSFPSPLFLVTALLLCYQAALVGRYLVRVIAALMKVYPILPAALLGLTTLLAFKWLPGFQPPAGMKGGETRLLHPGVVAMLVSIQMIFGFFTTAGLFSADWGTVARHEKDVRLCGWVGVAMASWIVSTLSLLTVAGAFARAGPQGRFLPPGTESLPYTQAVEVLAGGRLGGAILLAFGLAALAPACYSSSAFGRRMRDTWPRVSQTKWTVLVAFLAWLLILTGFLGRLFHVYSVLGGLLAPVAGALAADYFRSRGNWPGARRGYNAAGLIAWGFGAVVGLSPSVVRLFGGSGLANFQPAALFAFAVAFLTYLLAAMLGAEPPRDPRPELNTSPREASDAGQARA